MGISILYTHVCAVSKVVGRNKEKKDVCPSNKEYTSGHW